MGKEDARGELVFTGERYDQSLDSLYAFFREARRLMRRYPVGRIAAGGAQNHLGFFIAALLEVVIQPFLEQWQASYRHWWNRECERLPQASPFERQEGYPQLQKMLEDWRVVRRFCRSAAKELTEQFKLPDVTALEPSGAQAAMAGGDQCPGGEAGWLSRPALLSFGTVSVPKARTSRLPFSAGFAAIRTTPAKSAAACRCTTAVGQKGRLFPPHHLAFTSPSHSWTNT